MKAIDHAAAKDYAEEWPASDSDIGNLSRSYLALLSWAEREDVHLDTCEVFVWFAAGAPDDEPLPKCTCKPWKGT